MSGQNKSFNYNYSAAQQKEVEAIRKKYIEEDAHNEGDKMEQLRKLDSGVTKKATCISLAVGVISALIMGSGMSLVMTDIGEEIGMSSTMLPGIFISIVGMIGVIFAYPLYQRILNKERKQIAPQILKLIEELSQN